MLSIPATGLLNASPAVKIQQSQTTSDNPVFRQLNKDTVSFQQLTPEAKAYVKKKIRDPLMIVDYVEENFKGKTPREKKKIYEDIKEELISLNAYTGVIQHINNAINRVKAQI